MSQATWEPIINNNNNNWNIFTINQIYHPMLFTYLHSERINEHKAYPRSSSSVSQNQFAAHNLITYTRFILFHFFWEKKRDTFLVFFGDSYFIFFTYMIKLPTHYQVNPKAHIYISLYVHVGVNEWVSEWAMII